jgi:hypothetical protein
MSVRVTAGPPLTVGAAAPLFPDELYKTSNGHSQMDVFPDGRFAMLEADFAPAERSIHVVVNWIEEVKARTADGPAR